jgi:hypothetical protein
MESSAYVFSPSVQKARPVQIRLTLKEDTKATGSVPVYTSWICLLSLWVADLSCKLKLVKCIRKELLEPFKHHTPFLDGIADENFLTPTRAQAE